MLTSRPTPSMIAEWKKIFHKNRPLLQPNRKTGRETDLYFRTKYHPQSLNSPKFIQITENNLLLNDCHREKLPDGQAPHISAYWLPDGAVCVGIDSVTGFFHIESKDLSKMEEIHDDLFAFRGLDEKDLENFFLVAQYVKLTKTPQ